MNKLFYGDNLQILRQYIKDESIDLIYLDPPFNSKADYNILYKEPSGEKSQSQITVFEDTWHWNEEAERTFKEIIENSPIDVVEMMVALRKFIKENDVMAYLTMMTIRLIELHRVLKSTGSIYLHCDPTASHYLKIVLDTIFGKENFNNEIIWHYRRWTAPSMKFQKLHDVILFYGKSRKYKFNPLFTNYTQGPIDRKIGGVLHRFKDGEEPVFVSDRSISEKGVRENDVWQIPFIAPSAKERLGYPTQKPEALLEKIIKASSREGNLILDPFCGCGTTISVAQKLKRKWFGIDLTHLAINVIKKRLSETYNLIPGQDYTIIGEPTSLSSAKELASQNKYQFQWWITGLIGARPYGDRKRGADSGIDAVDFFMYTDPETNKDVTEKIIVSVKGGHVTVSQVRDLKAVVEREKAVMGFFVTLEEPTRPMTEEAVKSGFYRFPFNNKDYRKIQILTVEEILQGKTFDIPSAGRRFSHTKKAVSIDEDNQKKLF